MGEFVSVDIDGDGVATIRLDRPKVNALNPQIWGELAEAGRRCTEENEIKAVVIWGGPRVFAAGADIPAMAEMDFQEFFASGGGLQESFKTLARIPKVVIAAVNGYALGGGCELAMTADFRYAGESASFGQPEILLGIIPGAGGTQRLPRLIGASRAKELIYSGRQVGAQEALQMGLADRVFADEAVYEEAVKTASRMARGPYALRMAKKAVDEGMEMDLDSALRLETTLFTAAFATDDQTVGMRSFMESGPGKAEFTGR
jgi:enoyl-CoA hydratase/carnithine racemase